MPRPVARASARAASTEDAPAAASAAVPAAITAGASLRTADGKRAGQIFSVDKAADGTVTGAALIGPNSTLVHVPASTITAVDKSHFTTSMNYRDIFRGTIGTRPGNRWGGAMERRGLVASELEANKQVVRAFFTALGRGDAAEMAPLLASDLLAVATGTSFMSGTRNRDTVLATLGTLGSITQNGIDFEILSMTAESDRVSAEAKGRSTLVNGTPYNNEYHMLFTLRGGQIAGIREYFCTKLAEDAFGPLLTQQPA